MILGRKISKNEEKDGPLEIKENEIEEDKKVEAKEEKVEKPEPETKENEHNINEKNPPIFIKIDKYREILSSLTEMKLLIHKIKSNITLIQKVEEIEAKAFENSRTFFDELNKKLDELNTYFMAKSSGIENVPEMEELKKLEKEIEKLKKSLEE